MKILIVYASTEGQTRKIAEHAASHIRQAGHNATVCDSADISRCPDIAEFEAVLVAASVHQERHQDSIIDFVIAHRDALKSKRSAFISVSLSAVLEYGKDDAQSYVDRFYGSTQWTADTTLLLGGALRFGEYDYFKRQIVKHIVMKHGAQPSADQDYEFTDWEALTQFVDYHIAKAAMKSPDA